MKNPHDLRSAYAPPFLSFPVSAATLHPFSVAAVIAPSGLTPLAPPDPRHAASARAHVVRRVHPDPPIKSSPPGDLEPPRLLFPSARFGSDPRFSPHPTPPPSTRRTAAPKP